MLLCGGFVSFDGKFDEKFTSILASHPIGSLQVGNFSANKIGEHTYGLVWHVVGLENFLIP